MASGTPATPAVVYPPTMTFFIESIRETTSCFLAKLTVTDLMEGTKVLDRASVRFRVDTLAPVICDTDSTGRASCTVRIPLSQASNALTFSAVYKSARREESKIMPDLTPPPPPPPQKNPEYLFTRGYVNQATGDATVTVRVVDQHENGLLSNVQLWANGQVIEEDTNVYGRLHYHFTYALSEGEEIKVIASVCGPTKGILEESQITLKRRVTPKQSAFDAWMSKKGITRWLNSNNRRAKLMIVFMIISWVICWKIGWGNPLLVQPEVDLGDWQKKYWLYSLFFTIITFAYSVWSMREEFDELKEDVINGIVDRSHSVAGDMRVEKMMKFADHIGIGRKRTVPGAGPTTVYSAPAHSSGNSKNFGFAMIAAFVAETFLEIVPKAIMRFMKK